MSVSAESRGRFLRAMAQAVFTEQLAHNAPIPFEDAFAQGALWIERAYSEEYPGELVSLVDRKAEEYERTLQQAAEQPPVDQL